MVSAGRLFSCAWSGYAERVGSYKCKGYAVTVDVFSHPWLSGHFGDDVIAAELSAQACLKRMIAVEAAYARALGDVGRMDPAQAETLAAAIDAAKISPADLHAGTVRDGLPVPAFVAALKEQVPADLRNHVHKGLTSQDVMDTALVMTCVPICALFAQRLTQLDGALGQLNATFGAAPLQGRTRMQAALPMTVADRIRPWRAPLEGHRDRLDRVARELCRLQLGGAVGDRAPFGDDATAIAGFMGRALGLNAPAASWHTTRASVVDFAGWLALVTGSLGKMGQDIALMAQQGLEEVAVSGGGGSSAMPHKQNPVTAELLVTLAQFNATQVSGMHLTMLHEQERSGIAWSLEWMVLPQMIMATGRSLAAANDLCGRITRLGSKAS